MRIKYLLAAIIATSLSMPVFADNLTQDYPDGTNLMNVQNSANLDAKFVSSKKMYQISDAKSIVKMFSLNLVVNGQSNIDNTKNGVIIVSNGTVRDYLNILGDQFGYSWNLNGANVVFVPLNPVLPKKVLLPAQTINTIQNKTVETQITPAQIAKVDSSIVIINEKKESEAVLNPVKPLKVSSSTPIVKTPVKPLISTTLTTPNKDSGVWEIKLSDKTIKKSLQRWAKDAGWQLIWNANIDYPISASLAITGNFDYAINEVCKASQYTDNKIIGEFHPKNKVIVISTQDL